MVDLLKRIFRYSYYLLFGKRGKAIRINNEEYTVSAYVSRGINSVIDEIPLKLLVNLSKNADTVFDIGGNIGVIAAIVSKRMKRGSVIYSFEPVPLSFKYLADTARVQKGHAKIIPVNYAVSNGNNKLYFTNDDISCTNHIATKEEPGTIAIDGTTIDAYCKANNIIPQVFKIDIEGAEYWALEGMQKTLQENSCFVLVEIHPDFLAENHIDGGMFSRLIDVTGYKVYNTAGDEIKSTEILDNPCIILSKEKPPAHIFKID